MTLHGPHELALEIRRMLDDLQRSDPAAPGGYVPPLDVLETNDAFFLVVDLPAVAANMIRVVIKEGTVLIAGEKSPSGCPADRVRFHSAERRFGHFARAVQLPSAVDGSRASARLDAGELRITVPKIQERRGAEIVVPVETT